jgi:hypothetical protein
MKKSIYILLFFVAFEGHSQYIDFEENPNCSLYNWNYKDYHFRFTDIEILQKKRFVVYFRNIQKYLYQIDTLTPKYPNEKAYSFLKCQFSKKAVDAYGRDSIVFDIAPLHEAGYYSLDFKLKRKSLDKAKHSEDNINIRLTFSVKSPIMENAHIGFSYLSRHYNIGKVYRILPKPSIPLGYYQKGNDPLLATLFYEKKEAIRPNLKGKILQKGETSHFSYNYPVDKLGHFEDTLYVLTNGIDSLHEITISGELLEVVGDQPKLAHFLEENIIQLDTIRYDSSQGESYKKEINIKNIGKSPLIIHGMRCSNIICHYPTFPILPNQTQTIILNMYIKGRKGPFSKVISVSTNEPYGIHYLKVKGFIISENKD